MKGAANTNLSQQLANVCREIVTKKKENSVLSSLSRLHLITWFGLQADFEFRITQDKPCFELQRPSYNINLRNFPRASSSEPATISLEENMLGTIQKNIHMLNITPPKYHSWGMLTPAMLHQQHTHLPPVVLASAETTSIGRYGHGVGITGARGHDALPQQRLGQARHRFPISGWKSTQHRALPVRININSGIVGCFKETFC